MPTAEKCRPGPKAKPAAVKRTEWLKARCSPVEIETIRARAQEAGLSVSDWVRSRASEPVSGIRTRRLQAPEPVAADAGGNSPVGPVPDDYEQRVTAKMHTNGVPRHSAEILVKREMARER